MKNLILIALFSVFATCAFAHSPIEATAPADGATLPDMPSEIALTFRKDIRLTRVEMVHQDFPSVRLDLGEQTNFERQFTIPLQEMGDGAYRIEWRGLGADGHAMQGAFTFTVD